MKPQDSTLYKILLFHLQSGSFDHGDIKDLIEEVKREYLYQLDSMKGIANGSRQSVNEEFLSALEVEIKDMIKTITYGHFDLKSYNSKRKTKPPS